MTFDDDTTHLLGPGALARVDPSTVRNVKNVGDEPACTCARRQGRLRRARRQAAEGETSRFGPSGRPGQ